MKKIRKILSFFLLIIISVPNSFSADIYWYLTASMRKPGEEIVDAFNKQNKDLKVFLITGGSGELLSKVIAGKNGDIFTPGSQDYLEKIKNNNMLDSYTKLTEQTMVFVLSKHNRKKISTFNDLFSKKFKIATGIPGAMFSADAYVEFKNKLPQKMASNIAKNEIMVGANANQIINYLLTDVVDLGFLPEPLAKITGLAYIKLPTEYRISESVFLVTLKTCSSKKDVKQFKDFLFKNSVFFEKYGYKLFENKEITANAHFNIK